MAVLEKYEREGSWYLVKDPQQLLEAAFLNRVNGRDSPTTKYVTVSVSSFHYAPLRSYAWAIVRDSCRVCRMQMWLLRPAACSLCSWLPSLVCGTQGRSSVSEPTCLRCSHALLVLASDDFSKWRCHRQLASHLLPAWDRNSTKWCSSYFLSKVLTNRSSLIFVFELINIAYYYT